MLSLLRLYCFIPGDTSFSAFIAEEDDFVIQPFLATIVNNLLIIGRLVYTLVLACFVGVPACIILIGKNGFYLN